MVNHGPPRGNELMLRRALPGKALVAKSQTPEHKTSYARDVLSSADATRRNAPVGQTSVVTSFREYCVFLKIALRAPNSKSHT